MRGYPGAFLTWGTIALHHAGGVGRRSTNQGPYMQKVTLWIKLTATQRVIAAVGRGSVVCCLPSAPSFYGA